MESDPTAICGAPPGELASKGSRVVGTLPGAARPPNARPVPSLSDDEAPYQAAPPETGPMVNAGTRLPPGYTVVMAGLMERLEMAPDCAVRVPVAAANLAPPYTGHIAESFEPMNAAPIMGPALAFDADSHCVAADGHAAVADPLVMFQIDLLAAR